MPTLRAARWWIFVFTHIYIFTCIYTYRARPGDICLIPVSWPGPDLARKDLGNRDLDKHMGRKKEAFDSHSVDYVKNVHSAIRRLAKPMLDRYMSKALFSKK